jgi:hypothetical protein
MMASARKMRSHSCGSPSPVAVAAAVLNAQGRVAAAAFSIVVFNVVLLAALVVVLILQVGASRLAGDILSASIVIAGVV